MPHLSPMNWIIMITFIWISLMTMASIAWWSKSFKSSKMIYTQPMSMNINSFWSW